MSKPRAIHRSDRVLHKLPTHFPNPAARDFVEIFLAPNVWARPSSLRLRLSILDRALFAKAVDFCLSPPLLSFSSPLAR